MATPIGSIYASLEANFGQFVTGMNAAGDASERTSGRIRRSMGSAADAVSTLERHMSKPISASALLAAGRAFDNVTDRTSILRGALLATTAVFGGLTSVIATNILTRYADTWTNLKNQIGTVTTSSAQMRAELGAVAATADRSFSALGATATLFTRIQRSAPTESATSVMRYVETVQKGLLLGGATAEEARSAAIQFSQAIASNRLGGDEMRAVLETPLGGFLAKGLGVGIGELRTMGSQGLITTQQMLKALASIAPEVDAAFSKFAMSIDKAFTVFDNKATQAIGRFDETYGITRELSSGILALANSLDSLIPILAAVGAGMASAFAGRLIGGSIQRASAYVGEFSKQRSEVAKKAAEAEIEAARRVQKANDDLRTSRAAFAKADRFGDFSQFADRSLVKEAAKAEEELNKNRQKRVEITGQLTAEEGRLAALQQRHLIATPEMASSQQRIAELRDKLEQESRRGYYELGGNAAQARGAVQDSGRAAITRQINEQTTAYRVSRDELARAGAEMRQAEGSATKTGMAFGFLRNASMSLVGFLGGPWGVAFTTATLAMSVFAAKSMESAQRIREADAIIEEYQKRRANTPSANPYDRAEAERNLIDREIAAKREELAKVEDRMRSSTDTFSFSPREMMFGGLGQVSQEVNGLVNQLRNGAISVDDFMTKIRDLSSANGRFSFIADAEEAAKKIGAAAATAKDLRAEIDALNGKRASITIAVNANWRGPIIGSTDYAEMVKGRAEAEQAARDAEYKITQELKAKRAAATGDKRIEYEQRLMSEYGTALTGDKVEKYAKELLEIDKIAKAHKDAESAAKRQERAEEQLKKKIGELEEQSKGSYLGEFDRKVLQEAKGLKVDPKLMAQYRSAIESGNISGAPADLLRLRNAEIANQAGQDYRSIIQQYGDAAQAAQMWADKQAVLNKLVADGKITAGQSAAEMGKFISSFGNYSWITEMSGAITDFARSAVIDFKNLSQSAQNFVQRLETIIFNALIGKPMENWINGMLGNLVGGNSASGGGGGGGGGIFAWLASLFHTGGVAGDATTTRAVSPSTFNGAPRFHSGLLPGELPAILMKGETVLNTGLTNRLATTMSGLSSLATSNTHGGTYAPTIHANIRGSSGDVTSDRQYIDMVKRELGPLMDAHAAKWFLGASRPGGLVHQSAGAGGGLTA